MLHSLQHFPLVIGVLDLLHLDHLLLLEHLDCIVSLIVLGLHQVHSAERSRPKRPLDREVCEGIFALRLAGGGLVHRALGRIGQIGHCGLGGTVVHRFGIGEVGLCGDYGLSGRRSSSRAVCGVGCLRS